MTFRLYDTRSDLQTDDPFVVRYSGRYLGFYAARALPWFFIFAIIAALYLDDEYRRWIFSRYASRPKPFSWLEFGFLIALVVAPLFDLVLTWIRVRRGAVALSISPDGITGAVFHISRLLPWNQIADVAVDGKFLVVRRQPHSLLQKLFAGRGLGDISVPAHQLDHTIGNILAATRRVAPPTNVTAMGQRVAKEMTE
jgi:hypothetical protein